MGWLEAAGSIAGGLGSIFGGSKKGSSIKDVGKFTDRAKTQEELELERSGQAQGAIGGLMTDLQAQSRGEGPSLAGAQLKSAQEAGLAQQIAAAQAQRGGNPAALQRALLRSQAEQNQQLAQQAAQARMQEQLNAQSLLGQVSGQERALASGLAQNYLGQQFDMNAANAGVQREAARPMNEALMGIGGSLFGAAGNIIEGMGENTSKKPSEGVSTWQNDLSNFKKRVDSLSSFNSDKETKKDIKDASKDTDKFLDALKAYSYKYKEPDDQSKGRRSEGVNYGVMAQDLEKSKIGKSFVNDIDGSKSVDTVKGFGAVLAAQSRMHERIKELESKLKQKKS